MNRLVCLLAVVAVVGCGSETYRRRLARTSRYYAYLEKLDANLSTTRWSAEGISLRAPKQFQHVPEKSKKDGGGAVAGSAINFPRGFGSLPGILGKWHCDVEVGGREKKLPCFMFVTGNQYLWKQDGMTRKTADEYEMKFIRQIHTEAGETMPKRDSWIEKLVPEEDGFTDRLAYSVFEIGPTSGVVGLEGPYKFLLFTQSGSDAQLAILFVIPEKTVTSERLAVNQRIGMCLESLKFIGGSTSQGKRPRRKAAGGGLDF